LLRLRQVPIVDRLAWHDDRKAPSPLRGGAGVGLSAEQRARKIPCDCLLPQKDQRRAFDVARPTPKVASAMPATCTGVRLSPNSSQAMTAVTAGTR
jgi:hypothetical protein